MCEEREGDFLDKAQEGEAEDKESIKRAYEKAKKEISELGGWESFKKGEWLLRLIAKSFRDYFERANADYFRSKYRTLATEEIAKKLIKVAARNSAILGGVVGAVVSTDEIIAILTAGGGGISLPANITIALAAIASEAVLLVRMQLQLVANLGKLYEVPLNPDDPEDVLIILAYALGGSVAELAGKAGMKVGGRITEKAIQKHISKGVLKAIKKVARKIGVKILQRTIIKYAVPLASMGIGSGWNYLATKSIGRIATKHFKKRKSE